nr:hypothetical protein [Bifidobacterium felsineum]
MIGLPDALDPYLIPGTDVLRNQPEAQGTLKQLQWIHYQLFQDVYDRASQIARDSADESALISMFSKIVCTPDEYESRSSENITTHLQDIGYVTIPNIYRKLTESEINEELKHDVYRRMTN